MYNKALPPPAIDCVYSAHFVFSVGLWPVNSIVCWKAKDLTCQIVQFILHEFNQLSALFQGSRREVLACFLMDIYPVKNSFLISLSYPNSHMCVLKSGHRVWADLDTQLQDFCTHINHALNAHHLCQPPAHSDLHNVFWTALIIPVPIFMPIAVRLRASPLLGPVHQPNQKENFTTQKLNLLTDCPFKSLSWVQSSKWHNIFSLCAGQNCA